MTQELNKEGLEAAIEAFHKTLPPHIHEQYRPDQWKFEVAAAITAWELHKAKSHPKVTGFEDRIKEIFSVNSKSFKESYNDAWDLVKEMQAALAGSTRIEDSVRSIKSCETSLMGGSHEIR